MQKCVIPARKSFQCFNTGHCKTLFTCVYPNELQLLCHSSLNIINENIALDFVQTMNILIVNQSVIDMCASFFTLMTAVVEVGGTHMSRDRLYDQFVCRVWLTRMPLWDFLVTSSYNIFLMAADRYFAVVYPVWCVNNVRSCSLLLLLLLLHLIR